MLNKPPFSFSNIFRLFACCIPVKGASRSTLCDVQRNGFVFIPNILFEILTECKNWSMSDIVQQYGAENEPFIRDYFSYLIDNEYGFYTASPEDFPDMDLHWESPHVIENAIVDVGFGYKHNFSSIASQLDRLGCQALQIRFFTPMAESDVVEMLEAFNESRLRHIDLVMEHTHSSEPFIERLAAVFARVQQVHFYGAPSDYRMYSPSGAVHVIYTMARADSAAACGNVSSDYFTCNLALFSESQGFNSCLNKKISVDENGFIKNCPSMSEDFGHFTAVSLETALSNKEFSRLGNIKKDQIEVCRDCEFRYICTDCRAYVKQEGNAFAKPAKCSYDPYLAVWN